MKPIKVMIILLFASIALLSSCGTSEPSKEEVYMLSSNEIILNFLTQFYDCTEGLDTGLTGFGEYMQADMADEQEYVTTPEFKDNVIDLFDYYKQQEALDQEYRDYFDKTKTIDEQIQLGYWGNAKLIQQPLERMVLAILRSENALKKWDEGYVIKGEKREMLLSDMGFSNELVDGFRTTEKKALDIYDDVKYIVDVRRKCPEIIEIRKKCPATH